MSIVRELKASFTATTSGMKSAIQGVKRTINDLEKKTKKFSDGMDKNFNKGTSNISKNFRDLSLRASKSFEDIGKSIQNTGARLETWGDDIKKFGKTTSKALSPLTAFYATAAITGGKRMIANEQLDILMRNVFRTEEAYESAWKSVEGLTKGTAFMNADVGGWLSQLVQSNIELDKSEDIMKSILDFSVGSGQLGIEGEIHDVIMKAVRAGGWDQMTLDMLAQRGLNLAGHVANVLGVSTENAQEMLKSGEISMEESLDYFVDAVQVGSEGAGGYFANMADSAQAGGDTMLGAWINVKAALAQLGQDMWESGAWDQLKTALNMFTDFLYQLAPALEPMAKIIASVLATAVEWIQKLMTAFVNLRPKTQALIAGLSVIGAVLGPAIYLFGTFVGAVGKALKPLGSLFLGFSKVFEIIGKVIGVFSKGGLQGVITAVGSKLPWLAKLLTLLTGPVGIAIGIITLLATAFTIAYKRSETFRNFIHDLGAKIKEIFFGIVDWIKPGFDAVLSFFGEIREKFTSFRDKEGPSFLEAWQNIGNFIMPIINGIWKGIKWAFDQIKWIIADFVMPAVEFVIKTVWGNIKGVISGALDVIMGAIKVFSGLFTGDWQKMWEGVKQLVVGAVKAVWNYINLLLIGRVLKGVGVLVKSFGGLIGRMWTGAKNAFLNGITTIWNWLKNSFVGRILQIARNLGVNFIKIVKGFWNGVKRLFKNIVDSIVGFFIGLYMTLVGNSIIPDMVNAIVDWFKNLWKWTKDIVSKFVSSVVSFFKSLIDKSLKIFGSIVRFIIDIFANIKDVFMSGLDWIDKKTGGKFKHITDTIRKYITLASDIISVAWGYIKNTFSNVLAFLKALVTLDFKGMKDAISAQMENAKDFLFKIWKIIKDFMSNTIKNLVTNAVNLFTSLRNSTTKIFTAIWNFLKNLWNIILDFIIKTILNLYNRFVNGWRNIYNNTKSVFTNIWNFLRDIWNRVKRFIFDSVSSIFTRVRNTWNNLKTRTTEIFQGIYDAVKGKFDDIVDAAKKLPGRISDGLKNMASKVKSGVRSVVNTMGGLLEDGLNGVIGGINRVLKWIGVDDKHYIDTLTVPKFAKGGIHKGGPMIVGDGGKEELIQTPDGKTMLSPDTDTLMNAPKGTKILSGEKTAKLLNSIPAFKKGTSSINDFLGSVGSGIATGAGAVKDTAVDAGKAVGRGARKVADFTGDVWEYAKNPSKLLNIALEQLGISTPKGGSFIGEVVKGGFNTVKDNAATYIKDMFKKAEEESSAGPSSPGAAAWRSHIVRAATRMGESVSGAEIAGIIAQIHRESGGNQKIVQSPQVIDINTLSGNPARGLLQYIPQTFAAYKMAGHGNIYSGYDQLLAFFNNKNWRRDLPYGRRGWGPTGARKYADGGIVDTKQLAWIADGGWAESIISHDPSKKVRQQRIWQDTGDRLGFTDNKYSKKMLAELERIAKAVEEGHGHDIIINDRIAGEALEPHVTRKQGIKRTRKRRTP